MLEPIKFPKRSCLVEDIKEVVNKKMRMCTSASNLAGLIRTELNGMFTGHWQVLVGRSSESFFVYAEKYCASFITLKFKDLIDIRIQCVHY